MAERWIRISDLYARDDVRKFDGYYCVSLTSLSASLEQYGFKIVPSGHGAQRDAATAGARAHETATGSGLCPHGNAVCDMGPMGDCG